MRAPLSWIKEFVDVPASLTADELSQGLVRVGFEVEDVIHQGIDVKGPLVFGEVLSIEEITEFSDNDKSRLHQEVIYYLEKYDINEEVVRLKSHCNYFKETLKAGNGQGKKLGFIGQEMGREINTIGSKANHAEIQRLVVQMKDELEKVKEQSLNVL